MALLGDDLYAHQPLCEAAVDAGFSFLFVCKPTSHKTLYEWLEGLRRTGHVARLQLTRRKGRRVEIDTYEFAHHLPLRDGKGALEVNGCRITTTDANGKERYRNVFITNQAITPENVVALVEAARARWKKLAATLCEWLGWQRLGGGLKTRECWDLLLRRQLIRCRPYHWSRPPEP